jgi:hypothetical protein
VARSLVVIAGWSQAARSCPLSRLGFAAWTWALRIDESS